MNTRFDRLQADWGASLSEALEAAIARAPAGSPVPERARYHLASGGKRLRGMLPLAVADALGHPLRPVIAFGVAAELLHNATLIHDDLADGDAVRRGQPALWARYGAADAVHVGDALYHQALRALLEPEVPESRRLAVLRRFVDGAVAVFDGQVREAGLAGRARLTLPDVLRTIEGKTSALFALPLAGAAELCGAAPELVEALELAARHLGVLFQLQDDLLDLWGDKGRGARGNDLREGKRTLLVVHALDRATAADAARLRAVLDTPRAEVSDADVAWAIDLLEATGARGAVLDALHARAQQAVAAVAGTPLAALVAELVEVLVRPVRGLLAPAGAATAEDHAFCAEILPAVSRTFALSIELLPLGLRDAVRVAYLLCRVVDTIEDDADVEPCVREALFDAFDTALADDLADVDALVGAEVGASEAERVLLGRADAVFRVYRGLSAAQREAIRPWVAEMSTGMRETTRRRTSDGRLRIRDLADLERYCWYVAGTVGELLTALFRDHVGDAAVPASVAGDAARFGLGLQLVNILKDVAEDASRGVVWLPEDLLAARGLRDRDLLDPARREDGLAVVRDVAAVARGHLRAASRYTCAWPLPAGEAVRMFCAVPLALAWLTLDEVVAGDDTLKEARTPKVDRAAVLRVVSDAAAAVHDDKALEAWLARLDPERAVAAK